MTAPATPYWQQTPDQTAWVVAALIVLGIGVAFIPKIAIPIGVAAVVYLLVADRQNRLGRILNG